MKILVYGAGVIGSVYASHLQRGGHDVALLTRGKRLTELREHGVVLEVAKTGRRIEVRVPVVERPGQPTPSLHALAERRTKQAESAGTNEGLCDPIRPILEGTEGTILLVGLVPTGSLTKPFLDGLGATGAG